MEDKGWVDPNIFNEWVGRWSSRKKQEGPVVSVGYPVSARCLHFLMEVFYCSRQTRKNGIEFVPFLWWSGILTCPSRFMSVTR